jgi:hypothetical protein
LLPQLLASLLSNPLALAAAATPFIMDHVNSERVKLAAQEAHRASELARANKIASDVSTAMDNLSYLIRQAMFGIVFRGLGTPEDQEVFKAYHEVLMRWESSKSTARAEVEMYYGADVAAMFKDIQDDFETLAKQIDAGFFKRKTSKFFIEDKEGSKNDFRKVFLPVWDRVTDRMTRLCKEMILHIQREDVGSLHP